MTTAESTLDCAIEIELDLDGFEASSSGPRSGGGRRWSLITYPLIAAISAFAAVGILQLGPQGLWDRAQAVLHVSASASASSAASADVVSTPVVVRPRLLRSIDERVARMTPRMEEHASRKHAAPIVASSPAAPLVTPPPPPIAIALAPVAPAPSRPATRAPSTSLGISGTPNADDVAAANAVLQKAKGEHSF